MFLAAVTALALVSMRASGWLVHAQQQQQPPPILIESLAGIQMPSTGGAWELRRCPPCDESLD